MFSSRLTSLTSPYTKYKDSVGPNHLLQQLKRNIKISAVQTHLVQHVKENINISAALNHLSRQVEGHIITTAIENNLFKRNIDTSVVIMVQYADISFG